MSSIRNHLPWINQSTKRIIRRRDRTFKNLGNQTNPLITILPGPQTYSPKENKRDTLWFSFTTKVYVRFVTLWLSDLKKYNEIDATHQKKDRGQRTGASNAADSESKCPSEHPATECNARSQETPSTSAVYRIDMKREHQIHQEAKRSKS
ncbi:hypothetical protein MAR_034440 [Mya arenaria]|uniref:Uncharacterized protein n=1 Tax=Mya arenaria TaxID=6604 RepID=A0ABY7GF97_MYAAR|nr:hypothetical protein MAR_034440 [Mya arenaria]